MDMTYSPARQLIYLPARPTDDFKSFSAKILGCQDTRTGSSWFGPWYWEASVRPVPDGNIPPEISRVKIKLVFNDGGFDKFQVKFVEINGRLHHAAQLAQETGQTHLLQTVHDEQLPEYTGPAVESSAEVMATRTTEVTQQANEASQREEANQPVPEEPPPGYDEAQAQAVNMRFDERAREEAERS
jgi:WW domain-binding protein 2